MVCLQYLKVKEQDKILLQLSKNKLYRYIKMCVPKYKG